MIANNYKKIKVSQLQEIKKIILNEHLPLDRDIQIISYLTGKPIEELEAMDFVNKSKFIFTWTNKRKSLDCYRERISFLFNSGSEFRLRKYILVKGRIYKLLTDVRMFSASRNLGIKTHLQNGGADLNLNKLAALCYKPLFGSEKLDKHGNYVDLNDRVVNRMQKHFESVTVDQIAGGVFFYLDVSKSLNDLISIYQRQMTETMEEINHQYKNLQNTGAGSM